MYVKIENGEVTQYPARLNELHACLPVNPTPLQLEEVGIFNVSLVHQPQQVGLVYTEANPTLVNGVWTQTWISREATPEEVEIQLDQYKFDITSLLEAMYDDTAKSRRYDNRFTCALRAGYSGPFQAEGTTFAVWMDQCNAYAYEVMALVLSGQRALPTWEELKAELPVIEWPN